MDQQQLMDLIRNVPDFPQPGIQFKDITPLLRNGDALRAVIAQLVERYRGQQIDAVVGIESRGFILGAPIAYELGVGFIPVRKPGKLPANTRALEYALEYGSNTLEIHVDAVQQGERVLVVDDVLATGGTAAATAQLVEDLGGQVVELAFLIELTFLNGRAPLNGRPAFSLFSY